MSLPVSRGVCSQFVSYLVQLLVSCMYICVCVCVVCVCVWCVCVCVCGVCVYTALVFL